MKTPFFISTAIPYVNGVPHIGHALEYVQTDAAARFHRLLGDNVFFLTGTDENSLKNVQAAENAGLPVETYVNKQVSHFTDLRDSLGLSFDGFIRTTEDRHVQGAQKLWSACEPGDIYKKSYKGLYCVGCEAFYTDDELIDGNCPEHKKPLVEVEEENYFFRLSNYQDQLHELIANDVVKIVPDSKKNEVLAFIDRGLEDFSISRSVERAKGWGIVVPGDSEQIMYVWFDALANYITGLDYASGGENYQRYWVQGDDRQVVHVIGKGITRFHAIYWIAMLLSAKVPLPTDIFVHGYITIEGEKISKSLGNVIAPDEVVEQYGIDPIRYFLLGAISSYQDGDWSTSRFEEYYTAHLANGIGNLTSRVLTMVEKFGDGKIPEKGAEHDMSQFWKGYDRAFAAFKFDHVLIHLQGYATKLDGYINETKPWKKANAGESVDEIIYTLAESLRHLAVAHLPIIPESASTILQQLGNPSHDRTWGGLEAGVQISKGEPLFPRLKQ